MATLQVINIGSTANDGAGDPLRTAFSKVNNNFANLWSTGYNTLQSITDGNSTQVIFEWEANAFTQAMFQINSSDNDTTDSQSIVINSSINGALDSVRFTAHSALFHGDAVTGYEMDVVDGMVTLYATPLVDNQLTHFIAYQVTYDPLISGSMLTLNQDGNTVIETENTDNTITTEN